MLPVFKTAGKAVLLALGEDGLLRGATPARINIERGVQLTGLDAGPRAEDRRDLVVTRDVATLDGDLEPRVGDLIQVPLPSGPTYKLEKRVKDNGVLRRYVILEMP